jgi:RHS repeat-associated protein
MLVTDPEGRIRFYDSSQLGFTTLNGYMDKDLKPLGLTQTSYSSGLPSEFRDANGNTLRMKYDTRGNLTEVTDPLGNKTVYVYDANDNLISRTNPLNETWQYEYDDRRHLIRVTSPMGNKTTMTYNELGQMTGITDANQNSSSFGYDDFGNLEIMTDPLGHKKRITYDPDGFIRESIIDERNNEARFDYDNNDRLVSVTHPDGTSNTYGYDCCAEISSTDENGNKTTLIRDPLLFITQRKDSLGNTTLLEYDRTGKLVSTTDALGNKTTRMYDGSGRLTQITDSRGRTVQMGYDPNGKLTSLKDKRGKTTSFAYNAYGLLLSINNPLGQKTNLTRDGLGRVVTTTNSRGGTIGFAYDKDGRLTRKSHGGKTWADYVYDAVGNLTSVADSTGKTAYTYNGRQEVTGISYPDGKAIALSYDPAGNVSSLTYPGGLTVQYVYDSRNRVVSTAWGGNSVAYQYDGVGNLTHEVRSNGTESAYVRDKNNRTTGIQHKKGTALFASMAYTRDGMGKITQETMTLPVQPAVTARSISASYNDADQIIKWGADNYTYDADGNPTSVTGTESFSAVYDPENRLSEITQNGLKTTYTYDGMGNRTQAASGGQTRRFYHDIRGRLLFEANQSGQIVSYYIYRDDILAALGTPEGGFHFYHFDKAGSIIALTDGNGNISAAYAYEPFGKISSRSGGLSNPFTYAGALGVMEDGHDLFFMKNRHYDARRGKFLQKDPIGIVGGLNLYAYVRNNPVDRLDPAGLFETIFDVIARRVKAAADNDTEAGKKAEQEISDWDKKNKELDERALKFNAKAKWIADKVFSYAPGIGNVYGLGKGAKAWMEGKYIESLKESLGAFPGIGMPISLGTDLGEYIYIKAKQMEKNSDEWPDDVDWEGLLRGGSGGACGNAR